VSGGTAALDTAHVASGTTSIKLAVAGTQWAQITSDPFSEGVKELTVLRWSWSAFASVASGVLLITAICLDSTGAPVAGSPLSLFSGTPTNGQATYAGNSAPLPAGTAQVALVKRLTGTGSAVNLWSSAPKPPEKMPVLTESKYILVDAAGTTRLQIEYNAATHTTSISAPAIGPADSLSLAGEFGAINIGADGYIRVTADNGVVIDSAPLNVSGGGAASTINAEGGYKVNGTAGATGTGGGGDTVTKGLVTALGAAGLSATYIDTQGGSITFSHGRATARTNPSAPPYTTETADFSIASTDLSGGTYEANASGGAVQATLPLAVDVAARWRVTVIATDVSGGNVNVATAGSDNIATLAGLTSRLTLSTQYQTVTLQSNGVDTWYIIAGYGL